MLFEVVVLLTLTYLLMDLLIRLPKVKNVNNKCVFITGCDTGFGRDLAIRLDKLGFPVFAACLTQDGRKSLSKVCSDRLVTLDLNVTKLESIEAAVELIKANLSHDKELWAIVNNAGVAGYATLWELLTKEQYVKTLDVNLFGPIFMCKAFMPLLRASRGRIINMSSVSGIIAGQSATYTVSKFGVECFSDILRREVSKFGVKVSIIEPGLFKSSLVESQVIADYRREAFEKASPEIKSAYGWDYVDRREKVYKRILQSCSPHTYKVVDAYEEAITSVWPRPRYLVGNDAKYLVKILLYLPSWATDLAIAVHGRD